ncbi:hypothetical protein D9M73_206430 [compost metagenome]
MVTVALAGAFEQRLDHRQAVLVLHADELLAHQVGLPRVHQVLAVAIVDEEVAVQPEVRPRQHVQRLLPGLLIVPAAVVQRRDQAEGQLQVVFELGFLGGHDAAFHQPGLILFQLATLGEHQHADEQHRDDERQDAEGDDLLFELHGHSLHNLAETARVIVEVAFHFHRCCLYRGRWWIGEA